MQDNNWSPSVIAEIVGAAEQLHFYAQEGLVEPRTWRGFESHDCMPQASG